MDKKPVRVLQVFNGFYQGGIENFIMNVYRKIDRDKVQFDFAFLKADKGCFDDEAMGLGAHIYRYDSEANTLKNHYASLNRIIKEYGPYAAAHSHQYFFSAYLLRIARQCGVKIRIAHSHDTKKGKKETLSRKAYETFMRGMIRRNATHMLACSDAAGRAVFGANAGYQVLYNGIDLRCFRYSQASRDAFRKKLGVESRFVVLNVGRFADQKNHAFIVEAFDETLKRRPDAVLMLMGTGPLKESVEEKLREKNLLDKTIFLSNIFDTENYYNAADVFILPSKYEGMSIVSIEAQATGLPTLISANVTREVAVTDLAEYLDINDPAQWAEAICRVATRERDRSSYNAQLVETPFNIKRTVSDLERIYLSSGGDIEER